MSIKATFPDGADSITVSGLYQWDYGRVLEIEASEMGSGTTEIVEIHFACPNMSEAVVHSCGFTNGVGTVTIPDTCLEQSSPITAWIYRISGTEGHTLKTITLTVKARTRPATSNEIPQEISNKYTQLITEINEAVDALENGNVTAKQAVTAKDADYAATAGNASTSAYATSAGNASTAGTISKYLHNVYVNFTQGSNNGVLCFQIVNGSESTLTSSAVMEWGRIYFNKTVPCTGYYIYNSSLYFIYGITFTGNSAEMVMQTFCLNASGNEVPLSLASSQLRIITDAITKL